MLAFAIGFPLAIIIGETTRTVGHGRSDTTQERLEAFGHWQENLAQGAFLGRTVDRLFSVGGHTLITLSPERVEFLDFDLHRYLIELATTVFILGRIYSNTYYATSFHLNRYGIRVSNTTSVELTSVGSLWMLGGWVPVMVGGIWFGLMHSGLMHWLRSATRKSSYQGLFYFTVVLGLLIGGFNQELMIHTLAIVRGVLAAALMWHAECVRY